MMHLSSKTLGFALSGLMVGGAVLMPLGAVAQKKPTAKASASPSFEKDVAPFMNQYCLGCHTADPGPGGVKLAKKLTATDALKNEALWLKIGKNVANLHMPPQGMPQPSADQRRKMVAWVDAAFAKDCRLADPGRVTLRRLNREEYNNSVRDLTGVAIRPADDFPSDDVGYGFDNIGDVLSLSPLLMEKYISAAEKVARAAIRVPKTKVQSMVGDTLKLVSKGGGGPSEGKFVFHSVGQAKGVFKVGQAGWYRIRIRAGASQAGPEPAKMLVKLDRDEIATLDVKNPINDPQPYDVPVRLGANEVTVTVGFTNDFFEPAQNGKPAQDRNLAVAGLDLVGPIEETQNYPPSHKMIIGDTPSPENRDTAAAAILKKFASRAYRRPVSQNELDRLMSLYNLGKRAGEPFERNIQLGVQAVLCSPNFLYRVELDANPKDAKTVRTLNPYELASRLSYFLWSSVPDDQLNSLAKSGDLVKPAVLTQEVTRMLKDPRASALVDNFGMQWLQIRKLPNFQPDPKLFPTYSEDLMKAMITETRMYFDAILREDRPITEFIDSKFTYINEPLAKLYGIEGVTGNQFRKVALTDPNRGGVLMQASVLTVNSNPTRTSPTKRGKWVLEQILGTPPPPPPPGVGDLSDEKHFTDRMTLRQKMEEHRKNPACANCHLKMDALGFGMENFDAIGKWRTKDGNFPVDATATLPGGKSFKTPAQLKQILMTDKDTFNHALAEKLLTYALGRGMQASDKCHIDEIAKVTAKQNYKFSAMISAVVQSDPFRKRRGDAGQ